MMSSRRIHADTELRDLLDDIRRATVRAAVKAVIKTALEEILQVKGFQLPFSN